MIYAFNVTCPTAIKEKAEGARVEIREHNVIYKLIDEVRADINARLPAKEVEEVVGEAEVLQEFEISDGRKKTPVAGCRCVSGALKKSAWFRVKRGDAVIHEGEQLLHYLTTLRSRYNL